TRESMEGGVVPGYTCGGWHAVRPESSSGTARLDGRVYEPLRCPGTLRAVVSSARLLVRSLSPALAAPAVPFRSLALAVDVEWG
ncbi:hypothetical protein, partial [Herbidospora sp. RD11066]